MRESESTILMFIFIVRYFKPEGAEVCDALHAQRSQLLMHVVLNNNKRLKLHNF